MDTLLILDTKGNPQNTLARMSTSNWIFYKSFCSLHAINDWLSAMLHSKFATNVQGNKRYCVSGKICLHQWTCCSAHCSPFTCLIQKSQVMNQHTTTDPTFPNNDLNPFSLTQFNQLSQTKPTNLTKLYVTEIQFNLSLEKVNILDH